MEEREYEDGICRHLNEVLDDETARLIGRQVWLQDGTRLDLLAIGRDSRGGDGAVVTVIEVKAREATDGDVLQLLGYMGLVNLAFHRATNPNHEFCNERIVRVDGVLAAPMFGESASRIIAAIDQLRQCDLWYTVRGHTRSPHEEESRHFHSEATADLARSLIEAVGSASRELSPPADPEGWLEDESASFDPPDADDRADLPIPVE